MLRHSNLSLRLVILRLLYAIGRDAIGSITEGVWSPGGSMHATHGSRYRAPWLVVALAAIGVMALAVGIAHFAPASCPHAARGELRAVLLPAAAPGTGSGSGSGSGEAVFYDPSPGGGKCAIAPLASDGLYASLPRSRYDSGRLCGSYLDITGPLGTVRAEIVDMCPGCSDSQLDLSRAAFARIQLVPLGIAPVRWQLVSAQVPIPETLPQ